MAKKRPGGVLHTMWDKVRPIRWSKPRDRAEALLPVGAVRHIMNDMVAYLTINTEWGHIGITGKLKGIHTKAGSEKLFWLVVDTDNGVYHINNRRVLSSYVCPKDNYAEFEVGRGPDASR